MGNNSDDGRLVIGILGSKVPQGYYLNYKFHYLLCLKHQFRNHIFYLFIWWKQNCQVALFTTHKQYFLEER